VDAAGADAAGSDVEGAAAESTAPDDGPGPADGPDPGDEPVVRPFEVGEVPPARAIRRYTAQAGSTRVGAGLGALLGDLYYAVISVAIGVLIALGVAQSLRVALPPAPPGALEGPSLAAIVVAILVGLAGALVSLAGRLGPIGAGGAEATWWLGLPVDRRGLLRPASRRLPALGALAGAVLVGLLDAGLLGASGERVVRVVLAAALVAAALVLLAGLGQAAGAPRRRLALLGDLVLVAAPVLAIVLTVAGWQVAALPAPSWPLVLVLAVVVVALAAALDRRLGAIPARTLRESGSVASQAVGAVVSLDSRELGRALTDAAMPSARRRTARLRTARGAASALVTADLVVLRRSARHLVQLVVSALVPALACAVPQLDSPVGVLLALVGGGYVAMSATGEGARRAEMAPVLDRLLPLDARRVRRLRMVVPAAAMVLWSLVAFGALGWWASDVPGFLVLGVVSAPVWAGAAVRASYRPAPDWGGPLVSTPAGALPSGVLAVLRRGPDVVVLGLLPVWICVLLRTVSPTLLVVQLACTLLAVLVCSSIRTGSFMDRALAAQEETGTKAGAR